MKLNNKILQKFLEKSKEETDIDLGITRLHYKKGSVDLSIIYTYSNEELECHYEKHNILTKLSKENIELIFNYVNNAYEEELKKSTEDLNTWTNWLYDGTPIN